MGKRRKRMMMKKYAKKYAKKRQALGYDKLKIRNALIMIDPNGQEQEQEENIQVITNTPPQEAPQKQEVALDPEPQLIQVEEPPEEAVEEIVPPKPKTRRRRSRRKSTTTKKANSTTSRTRSTATKTKE